MLPFLVLAAAPNCGCGLMFCSDTATTQPRLLVVADRDAAFFVQQVLDVPQGERVPDVEHHGQLDDLGRGFEIAKDRRQRPPVPARFGKGLPESTSGRC